MNCKGSHALLMAGLVLVSGFPAAARGDEGEEDAPVLTGPVTREEVEAAVPEWVQAEVEAEIDPAAAQALSRVPPGGRVTVFLGTWCGDSRRELARLWRALDEIGGIVPFDLEYVAVDRDKKEPAALLAGRDLRYVPTLIVERAGGEVGRIVEISPGGVEGDLAALLAGTAAGVLTGRQDLAAEPPVEP